MKNIGTTSAIIAVLGAAVIVGSLLLGEFSFTLESIVVFVCIVLLGAAFETYRQWNW